MKVLVYILCHSDETHAIAQQMYEHEPWARILFIESTPYLESIMFHRYFPELEHEWANVDYVGTLSWKAHTKIQFDMPGIVHDLATYEPDVMALMPGKPGTLLKQAQKCHPKFKKVWKHVLHSLHVDSATATSTDIPVYYCNYWLAKPEQLRLYINFFTRVRSVLENDVHIQHDLWSDALYSGLPTTLLCQIFNQPYYSHHAFLCERLPCFFFWYINSLVMMGSKYVKNRKNAT